MADGRIGLEAIESSNLAAIGYDDKRQIVAVQFKSGAIFNFGSFPPDQMLAFYASPSRGKWFVENIKGKYPGAKMTGDCPQCGAKNGWIGDACDDCGCGVYQESKRTGSANGRAGAGQASSGIAESAHSSNSRQPDTEGAPRSDEASRPSLECGEPCEEHDDCDRACVRAEDHDGRHACKNHV